MDLDALKLRLRDSALAFGERLKLAVKVELEYWEDREPPNLPVGTFKWLVELLDDDAQPKKWTPRTSRKGKHAEDGEDDVFHIELQVAGFGGTKTYYIKGFFFEKGHTRGVEIQSCRDETKKLLVFSSTRK